jgi:hypothetical protein
MLDVPDVRNALVVDPLEAVGRWADDFHERRDLHGVRLVNLLKDLVVPETFLVAVDHLVIPNTNAGVAVLEEPLV